MQERRILKYAGFTIVELLIVIVVIAVLVSISVVAFNGVVMRAKDSSDATNISNVLKKIAEYHAVEGEYRQDLFIADGGLDGGSLSVGEVARLVDYGINSDVLRNPDAPTGIMNSYVFDRYDDDTGQWLSETSSNGFITMQVLKDLPVGYSNWDEVWNDIWDLYNGFYESYAVAHPYPSSEATDEEWNAWDNALESAFVAEYPEFEDIFVNGDFVPVNVPKTQVYFVRILGSSPQIDDACGYSGGERFYCYNYNSSASEYDDLPITGMKILYYDRSARQWKDKSLGSGAPFRNVHTIHY